jgi:hypothetical protein
MIQKDPQNPSTQSGQKGRPARRPSRKPQFRCSADALLAALRPAALCDAKVIIQSKGAKVYIAAQREGLWAISFIDCATKADWSFSVQGGQLLGLAKGLAGPIRANFAGETLEVRDRDGAFAVCAVPDETVLPALDVGDQTAYPLLSSDLAKILTLKTWLAREQYRPQFLHICLRFLRDGWRATGGNGSRFLVVGEPSVALSDPQETFLIPVAVAEILAAASPSAVEMRHGARSQRSAFHWGNTWLLHDGDSIVYPDERKLLRNAPKWSVTFRPAVWRPKCRALLDAMRNIWDNEPHITMNLSPDRRGFIVTVPTDEDGRTASAVLPIEKLSIDPTEVPTEIVVMHEVLAKWLAGCRGPISELHIFEDRRPIRVVPTSGENDRVIFAAQWDIPVPPGAEAGTSSVPAGSPPPTVSAADSVTGLTGAVGTTSNGAAAAGTIGGHMQTPDAAAPRLQTAGAATAMDATTADQNNAVLPAGLAIQYDGRQSTCDTIDEVQDEIGALLGRLSEDDYLCPCDWCACVAVGECVDADDLIATLKKKGFARVAEKIIALKLHDDAEFREFDRELESIARVIDTLTP